ncbi:hypothetical protein FRB94_012503 [Tulasnella sp. JGI-2019a]|nr:hypothetical protein FRB94_012503 [Tulasnella sp. JGI-2019a]
MSDAFGTRREFWAKYDTFADKFDKDMMARLNTHLDVLLLFAGLFSAINTAFIVVSLTALSANPLDETNHLLRLLIADVRNVTLTENDLSLPFIPCPAAIRHNCTFFASLCCSLLAATGAVLAKQWLQSYERTGQTGTVEQQSIRRTEKFVGAESWGLRPVVETLASLLLVSLALFSVALIDYLWTINNIVAMVVFAFAATGWLLYLLMVVLAATCSTCPFQTGMSDALKLPYLTIQRSIYSPNINSKWAKNALLKPRIDAVRDQLRNGVDAEPFRKGLCAIMTPLAWAFIFFPLRISTYIIFAQIVPFLRRRIPHYDELDESNMETLHAQSAILMAETASNADNVITVADNIPLISDLEAVRLIATSTAFQTLLSHLRKSFQDIRVSGEGVDFTNALTLARAVAHVVLADPKHTANAIRKCLSELEIEGCLRPIPMELRVLLSCVWTLCGLGEAGYSTRHGRIRGSLQSMDVSFRRLALQDRYSSCEAEVLQGDRLNSTAIIWLRHCNVVTTYNRWDRELMRHLVDVLGDLFLFEELKPDVAYLSMIMDALLGILRWHPLRGHRRDQPSLDDSTNMESAWTMPQCRPFMPQLLDTLNEFSRHYTIEDPRAFDTFLHCQQRLLAHVNALCASYDVFVEDHSSSSPSLSEIHSSLNSNIEHLLAIDFGPHHSAPLRCCEAEVVKTLQRFLLTSTARERVNPTYLADTARLARRVGTIEEKEQLLQGILLSIFAEVLTSQPGVDGSRYELLQKGKLVGVLLASTLQLYIWLHPSVAADQAWVAFESFLRLLATGGTSSGPPTSAMPPEAWDVVIQIAHDDCLLQHSCMSPGILWFVSRMEEVLPQMNEGKLVGWFAWFMGQAPGDEIMSYIPADRRGHRTIVERRCAGVLFLNAWDATMNAASLISQSSNWTSSDTIEAFATWLGDYDGQEWVDITMEDVILVRIPIDRHLAARFVKHATLANNQAVQEFKPQSVLERVLWADHGPRGHLLQDMEMQQAAGDAMSSVDMEDCEWCTEGYWCMHCDAVSRESDVECS